MLFRRHDRAIYGFGFAKSERENISKADLALLKKTAAEAFRWSDEELTRLTISGVLVEIDDEHND